MSVANISSWAANGLHSMQVAARGATSFMAGFANLTATNTGTGSGMHLMQGVVTAPSPLPGINRTFNRGEDGYIAGFVRDAQPGEFGIATESNDSDLEVFLKKVLLHTIGNWDMVNRGQSNRNFQDTIVLLSREAQDRESASAGAAGYDNLLIYSATYRSLPDSFAFQAAGGVTYQGAANRVTKTPWGEVIATAFTENDGVTDEFWSLFPWTMDCVIGDGTITALPLSHVPVDAASTKVYDFAAGTALTVSSVNTSAKTATVSAAPTSGKICVVLYEASDL